MAQVAWRRHHRMVANFGHGLYTSFLEPLNKKMWATHPSNMSHVWTSARSGSAVQNVPSADCERIKFNIKQNRDDPAWDENTRIKYPRHGGTGSIWHTLAGKLPVEQQHYQTKLVSINTTNKQATLDNGQILQYKNLITSMPIDVLLRSLKDRPDLTPLADDFQPAAVDIIGVGIAGAVPKALQGVCFLYIPEDDLPFWRLTLLSNYSQQVAPEGCWSILCEINSSRERPKPAGDLTTAVISGLRKLGFLRSSEDIVTTWQKTISHGYPVPLLNRDSILPTLQSELQSAGIYSRGRFGAWKYEESNQDHAFMQGVEAMNAISKELALRGSYQTTLPNSGNSRQVPKGNKKSTNPA